MDRRHLLITYDISDDKRRHDVFELLQANGDHAQYSVFLCQLDPRELATLKAALQPMINDAEDQILILDLGRVHFGVSVSVETLGKPYSPPVRCMIV